MLSTINRGVRALAREIGMSESGVRKRLKKGATLEQIRRSVQTRGFMMSRDTEGKRARYDGSGGGCRKGLHPFGRRQEGDAVRRSGATNPMMAKTATFVFLVCAVAGSEAQTVGPTPICAAMCKNPEQIKVGQTKVEVTSIMGPPPQTKGHGHKETWFYEIGPEVARNVLVVEFVDGKVTRSHALVTDVKRQKEAEKNAAREAARAAVEASDHLTVPLSGWISQTASGEAGCLALHDMAFRRDAQRGWGGLLGGGRNAYLGVSSNLVGVVTNTCTRELLVSIYGKFFNSSGLLLGQGSLDILVPASESRAFQVPWACSDGANYVGTGSTIWIPNCPADTARYSVRYE